MHMKLFKYLLLPVILLLSAGSAQAEVFERTLANGLKVIVKEDHRAPVIVQQIWYKAGSMDERTGTTGIAHVLEHMMFKGTRAVPAGEFSKRIAAAGGFAKEVRVVVEERRMRTDDDPQSLMYERLIATAYQEHPYQHPVIGWMSDLEAITVKDAQDWYTRWYAPNNATLVIAGDVKASEVFALAQRYYGSIPKVAH